MVRQLARFQADLLFQAARTPNSVANVHDETCAIACLQVFLSRCGRRNRSRTRYLCAHAAALACPASTDTKRRMIEYCAPEARLRCLLSLVTVSTSAFKTRFRYSLSAMRSRLCGEPHSAAYSRTSSLQAPALKRPFFPAGPINCFTL